MKIFGNYKKYPDGYEDEVKEILKKELHDWIDEICEDEEFWIKNERDKTGKDLLRGANTVGWKIAIPHMKETE